MHSEQDVLHPLEIPPGGPGMEGVAWAFSRRVAHAPVGVLRPRAAAVRSWGVCAAQIIDDGKLQAGAWFSLTCMPCTPGSIGGVKGVWRR